MDIPAKQPFYPFNEVDDTLHSGMQHKTMCAFHILVYSTDLYVMIYWYIYISYKIYIYIYIITIISITIIIIVFIYYY